MNEYQTLTNNIELLREEFNSEKIKHPNLLYKKWLELELAYAREVIAIEREHAKSVLDIFIKGEK